MMIRSTNIFGTSLAGLALFLLAGSTVAACPKHDTATRGDLATGSPYTVVVRGETCDQPEGKKTTRTVVLRIGSDEFDLGSGSVGDLKFDSDNLVVSEPQRKRQVIVKSRLTGFGAGGETSRFKVGGDALFAPRVKATFLEVREDDTITITIVNGKVSARINGKKVPADRIEHSEEGIRILGEDGEVVVAIPAMGGFGGAGGNGRFFGRGEGGLYGKEFASGAQPEPPRVMLGIQMQAVSEEAMNAYGLDEGEGIQIIGVIKGLPAQRAGLRENDIIIEITGVGRVTQEDLRIVLLSKEPGDVIEVEVIREGEIEEIEIQLTPYDAERLGLFVLESPRSVRIFEERLGGGRWMAGDRDTMIEKFMDHMGRFSFDEEEMEFATEALEEAMDMVRERAEEYGYSFRWGQPGTGPWRVIHGDEPEQVFSVPVAPRVRVGSDVKRELAALRDQLADVHSHRSELARELAAIRELLEKLARDRD